MSDARGRLVGAHAAPWPEPLAEVAVPPAPRRETLAVLPREARTLPESSGARAGRPTSSRAALGRTLRALSQLELPDWSDVAATSWWEEDADPLMIADSGLRIVSGELPAFGVPRVITAEPAYAQAVDWMVCAALASVARPGSPSYYFRLTTRPLDQAPFDAASERLGPAVLRRHLLTGAYRLVAGTVGRPRRVQIAAVGPAIPEALVAATALEEEGICADVVDVVSADSVYAAWQRSLSRAVGAAATPAIPGALRQAFDLRAPVVAVHDQATTTLAWLGSALGVPLVTVAPAQGSDRSLRAPVDPDTVVSAALAALSL